MAAIIERFIVCDGCGESYGVDVSNHTIERHRRDARADGWSCYGGKDYCPNCRKTKKGE
jgi:hypothetical protein